MRGRVMLTTLLDPENYRKTKPVAWANLAGFVPWRAGWPSPHLAPLITGNAGPGGPAGPVGPGLPVVGRPPAAGHSRLLWPPDRYASHRSRARSWPGRQSHTRARTAASRIAGET